MATFQQLVDATITVTNRPDLLAETELAVKHGILAYHHLDFFWRDKVTGIINVTTGQRARHQIPLTQFIGMRAAQGVRPYHAQRETCGKSLTRLQKLGEYQCDYWMLTPTLLIIASSAPTHQFEFTYWKNPTLAPVVEFQSWVAELYEDAVVDAACAKLFEMVRDPATADRYRARVGNKLQPGTHCHRILGEQLEQDTRSY